MLSTSSSKSSTSIVIGLINRMPGMKYPIYVGSIDLIVGFVDKNTLDIILLFSSVSSILFFGSSTTTIVWPSSTYHVTFTSSVSFETEYDWLLIGYIILTAYSALIGEITTDTFLLCGMIYFAARYIGSE